jgi:hypothetical protein
MCVFYIHRGLPCEVLQGYFGLGTIRFLFPGAFSVNGLLSQPDPRQEYN